MGILQHSRLKMGTDLHSVGTAFGCGSPALDRNPKNHMDKTQDATSFHHSTPRRLIVDTAIERPEQGLLGKLFAST